MKIIDLAIQTALKAGKFILKESQNSLNIKEKAKFDLVTNVDKASEELIIKEITKIYPKHATLGEESFSKDSTDPKAFATAEYIWIIDPIDGTTNFVHGLPHFAVSIGVFKNQQAQRSENYDYLKGELIAGVIYDPSKKELFYAEKSKGAYLNGKKISVSQVKKVEKSLAVTGFPANHREDNIPYFLEMLKNVQALRRYGSASLDLAYIAAGRFDIYWEFNLKAWDIAAGALIVNEAGGKVTDINGEALDLFSGEILATNRKTHKETLEIFSKIN